jgi:two-component system sensor histidine kinase QseC
LQGQLLLWVLTAVTLLWATATFFAWRDARYQTDELLDGHLAQAAAMWIVHFGDDDEVHLHGELRVAPTLHRFAPRMAFQLWHDNLLLLRSANAPTASLGSLSRAGFSDVQIEQQHWRVFVAQAPGHETAIMVGELRDARQEIVQTMLRGTLLPLAVVLPLLALVIWLAVRRALLPLRRLGLVVAGRRADRFDPVELKDAPIEIRPLVVALNDLFERIEQLLESERRFTADAAHELRTPIAAIRAQAQAALTVQDGMQRRRALQSTLAGCDRATRVIEQLLTLARLEASVALEGKRCDLTALVREEMAELAGLERADQHDLQLDAPDQAWVLTQPGLMSILVRNLTDNALRYSPAGSVVRVLIEAVGPEKVQLVVEDSGPGMTAEQRQRLGERFFRVTGNQASGSGLGWSIVRRISTAVDAQVSVDASADLGGLKVSVLLTAQRTA